MSQLILRWKTVDRDQRAVLQGRMLIVEELQPDAMGELGWHVIVQWPMDPIKDGELPLMQRVLSKLLDAYLREKAPL